MPVSESIGPQREVGYTIVIMYLDTAHIYVLDTGTPMKSMLIQSFL